MRIRSFRLGNPTLWLFFLALTLLASGCVLMEDPSGVEGVDISTNTDVTTDQSGDQDLSGDSDILEETETTLPDSDTQELDETEETVDLTCSDSNPVACGSTCVDCTLYSQVATASCVAGSCVIETCQQGYLDCDSQPANGCEQPENNLYCGESCTSCMDRENSTGGSCTDSTCVLACSGGYLDCDGVAQNGCEQPESDSHCGLGCLDCSQLDHVEQASCGSESCEIHACEWGWVDCNGDPADGCEAAVSVSSCGPACDIDCGALPGVEHARCLGASCGIVECAEGYANENGDWLDGCEHACALGECWTGQVTSFYDVAFFDDQYGIAGSSAGRIFITLDGGLEWHLHSSSSDRRITQVSCNEKDLALALDQDGKLMRSQDRGLSWEALLLPIGFPTINRALIIEDTIYLLGNGFLAMSEDDGETWTDLSDSIQGAVLTDALINDGYLYLASTGRLLRAQGDVVVELPIPSSGSISDIFVDDQVLYVVGSGFVYRSTNGGLDWEDFDASFEEPQLAWNQVLAAGDTLVLVANTTVAIRRSPEEAFVYVPSSPDLIAAGRIADDGTLYLYGQTLGFGHVARAEVVTIVETDPEGTDVESLEGQYTPLNMTYSANHIYWLQENGSVAYGGSLLTDQLWKSTDGGANFVADVVDEELVSGSFVDTSFPVDTRGFALRDEASIYFYDGAEWTRSHSNPNSRFAEIIFSPDDDFVIAIGDLSGVPTLTHGYSNGGDSYFWAADSATSFLSLGDVELTALASLGETLFVGTSLGELARSNNKASSWTTVMFPDGPSYQINAIQYDGVHVAYFTAGSASATAEIYYSPDNGTSWPDAPVPAVRAWPPQENTDVYRFSSWAWDGAKGVLVGTNGLILLTEDFGASWTQVEIENSDNFAYAAISGDSIVAASKVGLVYHSSDGGQSFAMSQIDVPNGLINGLSLLDGRILAVGDFGQRWMSFASN